MKSFATNKLFEHLNFQFNFVVYLTFNTLEALEQTQQFIINIISQRLIAIDMNFK